MKITKTIALWLFILCLPVLLVTATIGGLANSLWLYRYSLHEYGIRERLAEAGLSLSDEQLEGVYAGLINYYNSGQDSVRITVVSGGKTIDFFSLEEVTHFKDVKGLIRLDYWILSGTIVYILAYAGVGVFRWRDRRSLTLGLLGGSIFTLSLLVVLAILNMLFGFNELFTNFHLLFFTNQFWSAQGNMLLIFPEQFFNFAATLGAGIIAGAAVIIGVLGWWLRREKEKVSPSTLPPPSF